MQVTTVHWINLQYTSYYYSFSIISSPNLSCFNVPSQNCQSTVANFQCTVSNTQCTVAGLLTYRHKVSMYRRSSMLFNVPSQDCQYTVVNSAVHGYSMYRPNNVPYNRREIANLLRTFSMYFNVKFQCTVARLRHFSMYRHKVSMYHRKVSMYRCKVSMYRHKVSTYRRKVSMYRRKTQIPVPLNQS